MAPHPQPEPGDVNLALVEAVQDTMAKAAEVRRQLDQTIRQLANTLDEARRFAERLDFQRTGNS